MKKIASILLVLMLVLTMAAPALAEGEPTHTITITNPKSGHTYSAYQVFQGDITGGKLTNIDWGDGVNGAALLTALKELEAYKDCTSAEDVADVLVGFNNDSVQLDAFAEVVGKHLSQTSSGTSSNPVAGENVYTYTINVTGDGYYFVKDTGTSVAEGDAYTKYILHVVGDVEVDAKAEAPTLVKEIVEGSTKVDANNASIGDKVNYELTSKVPKMDGYEKYYFVVNDTLSKGLTFNNDVAIKIGEKTLAKDTDYTVTVTDNSSNGTGTSIEIVFKNFIQYKDNYAGKDIVITYSAKLNENAVIGSTGNPNKVKLTYSNNPNITDDGTTDNPDKPTDNSPVGKTPEDTVITYVTGIELTKENEAGDRLEGAEFKIEGEKLNTVLVTGERFVEDKAGTYYKLKDGTYTTKEPGDNSDLYDDTEKKYALKTTREVVEKAEDVSITAVTGTDGILRFDGLSAGTYTITEIKAPDGYNMLEAPITIIIEWTAPTALVADGTEMCTWAIADGDTSDAEVNDGGIITLTVANKAGAVLPTTGGMGTTIFYVLGGLLIVAAGVALITRRRMSK